MAWVVDTCVLIDVLDDDPDFAASSAELLDQHLEEGLVISPVTYAELAPAFTGDRDLQGEFLSEVGIVYRESWTWEDTLRAHTAWNTHVQRRRENQARKRPLADILIGAFAQRFQGLITRNPDDFQPDFPELALLVPSGSQG
jgi:predicted nucleic acid-binding protein